MVLAVAFRFFFSARFFLAATGSTDLRIFFNTVPSVSVLLIPLLVFRLREFVHDFSLPLTEFEKVLALALSTLAAFLLPLILLLAVPVFAQCFGNVEGGQLFSGYLALILYGLTAISLSVFFSSLFTSPALALLISAASILAINTVHLLPLYIQLPSFLSWPLEKISFAWHFDAAAKGIIDSRDITFYLFASFLFLLLAVWALFKHTGRKVSSLSAFFLTVLFISSAVLFSRAYIRFDITSGKTFSVSATTRALTKQLEEPLRITYFRSRELKNRYPQTNDVAEYLKSYANASKNITLHMEKADEKRLSELGIQGQQLKSQTGSKTEYITVYSAILLQYLGKKSIIPFVLTADSLEYDLTRRVKDIISDSLRQVYLISGNGRSLSDEYGYVSSFLTAHGFSCQELLPSKIESQALSDPSSLFLVLGSSSLSYEESHALKTAVEKGARALIATSPYSAAVESDWNVSKNAGDTLLPILSSWGFAFENALVNDLSNFPLALQSGEGSKATYETVNYPLWISILPQKACPSGMTLFWASPISLYENTRPLLVTTDQAWLQSQSEGGKDLPFLINPFEVEKTASKAGKIPSRYTLAATSDDLAVSVIADQYFVHSLLTGFIASESAPDFRNFQFLAKELLNLRGENELASLLDKKSADKSLYKITDEQEFVRLSKITVYTIFIAIPLAVILAGCVFALFRWKKNKKQEV